jgi:acyl-CoA thioesterase-1
MVRIVLLWAIGWLLSLPAAAESTLLVVGDSLSAAYGLEREQGWVALLDQRLAGSDWRVINASISGETTRGGLTRLPALLEEHAPAVVIVALGGNDGLRGIPLDESRRSLAGMVERVRETGARVLLVGVRLPSNYGRPFIERFQAVFREVADEHGVALVPMLLAGVGEHRELIQADGLHPTAAAQPRLLENVWVGLEGLLE